MYDLDKKCSSQLANLPEAKQYFMIAWVRERLLVCGGRAATGMSDTCHSYDPAANTWSAETKLPGKM